MLRGFEKPPLAHLPWPLDLELNFRRKALGGEGVETKMLIPVSASRVRASGQR